MSDRSVFLYAEHGDSQCGTCALWTRGDRCMIHGSRRITASMACCFYVHGTPRPAGTTTLATLAPEESGLVDREVRCENCHYFLSANGPRGRCRLFARLNRDLGDDFHLDAGVAARGCCTAQTPRDEKQQREDRLKQEEL